MKKKICLVIFIVLFVVSILVNVKLLFFSPAVSLKNIPFEGVITEADSGKIVVDEFVALMEEGFRSGAEALLKNLPGCRIDEYMLHWLAHMDIEMFIHLLTHVPEKDSDRSFRREIRSLFLFDAGDYRFSSLLVFPS